MSDCIKIGNKEEEELQGDLQEQGESSTNPSLQLHSFQDHRLLFPPPPAQPPMHHPDAAADPFFPLAGGERAGGGGLFHPWAAFPPQITQFNPTHQGPDPFLFPPPAASSTGYGGLFGGRRPHYPYAYDGPSSSADPLRILSEAFGQHGGAAPFGLHMQAELSRMTAQEIMDAKALAASKSHSEAERRRRERINNHLAKLRSLLPSTTKTDKASLLAEVIHHVKELKRQTTAIAETTSIPTEADELTVDPTAELDSDGRLVVKASLCCDDRTDLLPDLIKALKALRLRTLRAEITTLGGRVKNVLFITGDDDNDNTEQWSVSSIEEALRVVMEKSGGARDDSATGNAKRQRTNGNINILS